MQLDPVPLEITGTIVVLDEHGHEHREESGSLSLAIGSEHVRRHIDVLVREGRWSAKVAPAALHLGACRLGNRPAVLAPGRPTEVVIPPDGRVELRVRWFARPLLHVRARDTKLELENVTLCELPLALNGSTYDARHPGALAMSTSREVGSSPVRIEEREHDWSDSRVLFVKAPGYAWARIEIGEAEEREQTIWLDPAGALELEVVGEPQRSSMEIVLLEKEPLQTEILDVLRGTAESFFFEDLRPGTYVAQARDYGVLAGAVELEVLAGERVKAVLDVVPQRPRTVPVEGVLVMPEEYSKDFSCEFLLQSRFVAGMSLSQGSFKIPRAEMAEESRGRFRWSVPLVASARYLVNVNARPADFATELDTGPSGTRNALIEVPRPCLIAVHCVDEESGVEVSSEWVESAALTPRAFQFWTCAQDARLEFYVPQGRVLILTRSVLYEPAARVVEAAPGKNEVLLLLCKKP